MGRLIRKLSGAARWRLVCLAIRLVTDAGASIEHVGNGLAYDQYCTQPGGRPR